MINIGEENLSAGIFGSIVIHQVRSHRESDIIVVVYFIPTVFVTTHYFDLREKLTLPRGARKCRPVFLFEHLSA